MNLIRSQRKQGGATLVVGLIMLAVITLLVSSAFTLSSTNQKAVGNMQFRNEALAAANVAIEQVMTAFVLAPPVAQSISVDLNNDGNADYIVQIVPTCISSAAVAEGSGLGKKGSQELGTALGAGGAGTIDGYVTVWDIDATVTETASGASVRVHQGIRKPLPSDCV